MNNNKLQTGGGRKEVQKSSKNDFPSPSISRNLFTELEKLLRMDSAYCTEDGVLIKNKIVEAALELRSDLIAKLLTHDGLKHNFFTEISGVMVFDKVKFQKFVMNKRFLPDSYTSFKNKVGLTNEDGDFLSESREVVLSWPYKDCVLEGGQTKEDAKRNEVFWNEILAPDEINRLTEPKVLTNFKRYDADGEHEVENISMDDNIIIKGNNLLALHSLKKKYAGKVKLIYIDPPYNTGNDSFGYNDNFNQSTWLTFMKNRLDVAKKLLSDDGVICVQCDDNEQAYLKVLLDSMEGIRFINCVAVKMSEASGVKMNHAKQRFPKLKEYILIYVKDGYQGFYTIDKYKISQWDKENNLFLDGLTLENRNILKELEYKDFNSQEDIDLANKILKDVSIVSLSEKLSSLNLEGKEFDSWLFENAYRIIKTAGSSSLADLVKSLKNIPEQNIASAISKEGVMFFYICNFNRETRQPRLQVIFADSNIYKNPCDFWQDIKTTGAIANEGGVNMKNGKKPEKILHRLISMITQKQDIVLDFFGGSGTTAAVAHKMNRRYISVEQMDSQISLITTRLNNVISGDTTGISKVVSWQGGGSFVYCELARANYKFADEIERASTTNELLSIWQQTQETGFLSWKVNLKEIDVNTEEFSALDIEDQKRFLIECLDKNLLYVPYSEIDNAEFAISENDKKINNKFYQTK